MPVFFSQIEHPVLLDGVLQVTHNKPLRWLDLLININPANDHETIVYEQEDGKGRAFLQATHELGSQSARLNFLLTNEDTEHTSIMCLLEEAIRKSGDWGAINLLAELNIDSPFFEAFKRVDFSLWATQRFWQIDHFNQKTGSSTFKWQVWNSSHMHAIKSLHQSLLPKIFHNVEPITRCIKLGLVCTDNQGNVKGFADLAYGPKEIWILPVIQKEVCEDSGILSGLLCALPSPGKRNIFLCLRSYLPWLEKLLLELKANSGPEQACMVRYMAIRQKVLGSLEVPEFKNGRADTGIPVAHIKSKSNL